MVMSMKWNGASTSAKMAARHSSTMIAALTAPTGRSLISRRSRSRRND